jgi:hypothetical protein
MQDYLSPSLTEVVGQKYLLQLKLVHQFLRESLGDKERIESKGVLKLEVQRSQVEMRQRKQKKLSVTSSSVQIVKSWAIGKTTQSVHLMGQKRQVPLLL